MQSSGDPDRITNAPKLSGRSSYLKSRVLRRIPRAERALREEKYLGVTDEASSTGSWQTRDSVPTIHFVVEAFQCHLTLPPSFPVPASWRKKPRNPIKLERVGGRTKALSMSASVRILPPSRTPNGVRRFKRDPQSDGTQLFVAIPVLRGWEARILLGDRNSLGKVAVDTSYLIVKELGQWGLSYYSVPSGFLYFSNIVCVGCRVVGSEFC